MSHLAPESARDISLRDIRRIWPIPRIGRNSAGAMSGLGLHPRGQFRSTRLRNGRVHESGRGVREQDAGADEQEHLGAAHTE